jgi:outer membrane protein assembly factor BamB
MPLRRACSVVLACACAVAGLAGCSSGQDGLCVPGHCPIELIPGHAYALDVTTAGRVRWQAQLPTPALGSGLQVSPLAVGAVAVFAQADVLYGLRLAYGHRLWSRAVGQPLAGMWRWQNLVVVLTQPGGDGLPLPVLTGLDASTGQPRWTLRIGWDVEGLAPTADGGLAIAVARGNGVLEVVDLSSGRVRWTRPVGSTGDAPPMAVGGGAVVFAANSQLTSYDDRTGQVRWTEALAGPPDEVVWQASAGLVYLTGSASLGAGQGAQALFGISAADGRVQWQIVFRFAHTAPPASLDPYAPGLMSVTTSSYSGGTSQDELDPATGRVRWHVVSPYPAIATPAGVMFIAPRPDGTDQISVRDTLTGQTRWTAEYEAPQVVFPQGPQVPPVFPAGPLLVVPAADPDGSDLLAAFRMSDGHRAWQVTIPEPVAAPLSAVPGGMLIYSVVPARFEAP